MNFVLVSPEIVELLHDSALNPGELPGRARDKSLEWALSRVENGLAYGMIQDVFDLAAAYAVAVSQGHVFNDGNKRTAFETMNFCLDANGVLIQWEAEDAGNIIIQTAQRLIDEDTLADWLRSRAT